VLILKQSTGEQPKIYSPDMRLLGITLDDFPTLANDWVMGYVNNESTVGVRCAGPI
jgi:hypothetical protein